MQNIGVTDAVDGSDNTNGDTDNCVSPITSVEGGVDIDDNLQDELCKLWDMAMNTVRNFPCDFISNIYISDQSQLFSSTEYDTQALNLIKYTLFLYSFVILGSCKFFTRI